MGKLGYMAGKAILILSLCIAFNIITILNFFQTLNTKWIIAIIFLLVLVLNTPYFENRMNFYRIIKKNIKQDTDLLKILGNIFIIIYPVISLYLFVISFN